MAADPSESASTPVDPSVLAAINEPTTPQDSPDALTEHDRDLIEGPPALKLDKERIRARKVLERQIKNLTSERDELRKTANLYERLDDRRKGGWITGAIAGLAAVGGATAAMFPENESLRTLGGATAIIAAGVLILISIHQARRP